MKTETLARAKLDMTDCRTILTSLKWTREMFRNHNYGSLDHESARVIRKENMDNVEHALTAMRAIRDQIAMSRIGEHA